MIKSVLLHGGGLDSTAVLVQLVSEQIEFDVLHAKYGQVAATAEWAAIRKQCMKYHLRMGQMELPHIALAQLQPSLLLSGDHAHDPIIDGRNLFLIFEAVRRGYSTIYVGLDMPESGHAWPDASVAFVEHYNALLKLSFLQREVRVVAPFIGVPKVDIFRRVMDIDPDLFELSATCWTPVDNKPCGKCKHCLYEKMFKEKLNA